MHAQASLANGVRVAGWQALCLLLPHMPPADLPQALDDVWSCLTAAHAHANVRPLVQLAVLVLLEAHPGGVDSHLLPALRDFEGRSYQVGVIDYVLLRVVGEVRVQLGSVQMHVLCSGSRSACTGLKCGAIVVGVRLQPADAFSWRVPNPAPILLCPVQPALPIPCFVLLYNS